jgi:lysyl-tRNA synthetase class 1
MIKMYWGQALIHDLKGKQKVSTGISPSGPIHMGNLREILTGDIIYKSLLFDHKESDFIYLADDIDPLRKVYPFLPETYSEHVGKPLKDIPSPDGIGKYSDFYLNPFISALKTLDVKPEVIKTGELYRDGKFGDIIGTIIEKREDIKNILEGVSGREMEETWFPYNPKCSKCGRINSTTVIGFKSSKVEYICKCGNSGESDIYTDQGKLPWRIEWPAKWKILNVTIEPFGKDHGTQGGSYDTGKLISEKILNYPAPVPLIYERILLKGKGAMHSSTGVNIPAQEILSFAPPEIVRYVMAKVPATRHIEFDPSMGFLNTMDEFERLIKLDQEKKTDEDQQWVIKLSMAGRKYESVPDYRHLSTLVQIYESGNRIEEIFKKEGKNYDKSILLETIDLVKKWVETYAPENSKFHILGDEDPYNLSNQEMDLVCNLHKRLKAMDLLEPEEVHECIRQVISDSNFTPQEGFKVIYRSLIGMERGPRLGFFLSVLPREKLNARFDKICEEKK